VCSRIVYFGYAAGLAGKDRGLMLNVLVGSVALFRGVIRLFTTYERHIATAPN
jgi:hypothetical protein